ncbi:hypothetical protein PGT21_020624 [Puccinia graminis f. sp. tritici]|uniref:Uncharacterized protein n=1 Tax=Puccinia graminis f. sp. tritici TaxID=56615 RepID=A0A5B0QFW1_PUCGR|nr:hypothetical protein PGT21_020624 [Puccinia graminis f. sp. tritici]
MLSSLPAWIRRPLELMIMEERTAPRGSGNGHQANAHTIAIWARGLRKTLALALTDGLVPTRSCASTSANLYFVPITTHPMHPNSAYFSRRDVHHLWVSPQVVRP